MADFERSERDARMLRLADEDLGASEDEMDININGYIAALNRLAVTGWARENGDHKVYEAMISMFSRLRDISNGRTPNEALTALERRLIPAAEVAGWVRSGAIFNSIVAIALLVGYPEFEPDAMKVIRRDSAASEERAF